jgi:hypothetical protein
MVRIIIGFPWCVLVVVMMAVFTHGVGGLGIRGNPRTKTIGKSSGVVDVDGGESVAGNDPATAELLMGANPGSAAGPFDKMPDEVKAKDTELKAMHPHMVTHALQREYEEENEGNTQAKKGGMAPGGVMQDNLQDSVKPSDSPPAPPAPEGEDDALKNPFKKTSPDGVEPFRPDKEEEKKTQRKKKLEENEKETLEDGEKLAEEKEEEKERAQEEKDIDNNLKETPSGHTEKKEPKKTHKKKKKRGKHAKKSTNPPVPKGLGTNGEVAGKDSGPSSKDKAGKNADRKATDMKTTDQDPSAKARKNADRKAEDMKTKDQDPSAKARKNEEETEDDDREEDENEDEPGSGTYKGDRGKGGNAENKGHKHGGGQKKGKKPWQKNNDDDAMPNKKQLQDEKEGRTHGNTGDPDDDNEGGYGDEEDVYKRAHLDAEEEDEAKLKEKMKQNRDDRNSPIPAEKKRKLPFRVAKSEDESIKAGGVDAVISAVGPIVAGKLLNAPDGDQMFKFVHDKRVQHWDLNDEDSDYDLASPPRRIPVRILWKKIAGRKVCLVKPSSCSLPLANQLDEESVACTGVHKNGTIAAELTERCRIGLRNYKWYREVSVYKSPNVTDADRDEKKEILAFDVFHKS